MAKQPFEEKNNGLNDPAFIKDEQVESLFRQIFSIIQPAIQE